MEEMGPVQVKRLTGTGSQFPKVNPVVTAGGVIFTGTRDRKCVPFTPYRQGALGGRGGCGA
jgi:hypothetical protein